MSSVLEKELCGWGRYPVQSCKLSRPERYSDLRVAGDATIARGQGRAYGDAALNEHQHVVLTERLNRILAFDDASGVLRAEAGLTIEELLEFSVPRGWFPLVTPGTKFVSLGGCVAADVHGKNHHHVGAFSSSVLGLELITADGSRMSCNRDENSEAFWATVGGMGLTGIIGEVTLQLQAVKSAYIEARHYPANNLKQAFELFEEHDGASYSVAWIDLLARGKKQGRSVVMVGEHAAADSVKGVSADNALKPQQHAARKIPFDMPSWMLNPLTIGAFNKLYYRVEGGKKNRFYTDYEKFFYPLDSLTEWNRLYGKRGFIQYQCVVPREGAFETLSTLLDALAESKQTAFLGVLKKMGEAGDGLLSFPMAGYTLALDLPFSGDALLELLQRFDEIVTAAGGRVYLAKDARLDAEYFRTMYPHSGEFARVKRELDPDRRFSSSLSRRLALEAS